MSCFTQQCPTTKKYPTVTDVPVVNPCEGFGYKAPFRNEVPFKLMFVAQWYNERAEIEKKFLLSYFHYDGTVELKDLDRQKLFLHRRKLANVKLQDLFIGNKLYVLGRHVVILDYGDGKTREYCSSGCERALLIVRPESLQYLPNIVQRVEKCFRILYMKMVTLSEEVSAEIAKSKDLHLMKLLVNMPAVAFFLMAENALEKLKNLVGEDLDPKEALLKNHLSLRAMYAKSATQNGFYYSENTECIMRDASYFFSGCPQCTLPARVRLNGSTTCCVIKPHILKEGRAGVVLADIVASGFEITAIGVYWMSKRQAEEFYEIYQRIYVASEYMDMVDELSIGPCMAVELALQNGDGNNQQGCGVVEMMRQCTGPYDPDLARKVRPMTFRARHGLTKTKNAIHCTDLPEDAVSELEYFFRILDRRPHGLKCASGDMNSC